MSLFLIAVIAGFVIPLLLFVGIYNNLNRKRNRIENAKSLLDTLFIRRSDLIPNLVATVKQYTRYESGILEKVVRLRNNGNKIPLEYEQDGEMTQFMKSLMLQVENYPELRASEPFTNLQHSWNEAEEQIASGRRYLSTSIMLYNHSVQAFPANILARLFGFGKHEWGKASEQQRKNINADNLSNS